MLTRPAADARTGADLRILEGFNLDGMAKHGGLPRAALAKGACCRSADSLLLAIASAHLRFCPACLREGFHATLFQFTPIVRCPIHHGRLQEICLQCRAPVPYRLDAAFAARPFGCPGCAFSFLPEPTVLAQPRRNDVRYEHLLNWQRFLGHYAYWYVNGKLPQRDNAGRFVQPSDCLNRNREVARRPAFVGTLQLRLREPPPLPRLISMTETPPSHPSPERNQASRPAPPFSRDHWPRLRLTADLRGLHQRVGRTPEPSIRARSVENMGSLGQRAAPSRR